MVGITWDYTGLAAAVDRRPGYAEAAIDRLIAETGLLPGHALVCDIGAGTGKLTLPFVRRGHRVVAVEPNPSMMKRGIGNTAGRAVAWMRGVGEALGLAANAFDLVSFGSSFNVVDRGAALSECARILKPAGWLVCLWNHRDLNDPLQREIEAVIHRALPGFSYGSRRQDQTPIIARSGHFESIRQIEERFVCSMSPRDALLAWSSHATLLRQAEGRFDAILDSIGEVLRRDGRSRLPIPYFTRAWLARRK